MNHNSTDNKPTPLKRKLAFIGAICLVCLYFVTLLAAFFDPSAGKNTFKFLLFCCFVFPVLLYFFLLFVKLKK